MQHLASVAEDSLAKWALNDCFGVSYAVILTIYCLLTVKWGGHLSNSSILDFDAAAGHEKSSFEVNASKKWLLFFSKFSKISADWNSFNMLFSAVYRWNWNVGNGDFSTVDVIDVFQQLLHHSKSTFKGNAWKKKCEGTRSYFSERSEIAKIQKWKNGLNCS